MKLDDLYFVPAYVSPFKAGEPLDPAGVGACHDCTPRQRLDMLQLATRHHAGFHVDDFEIVRGEVSYTIDTVDYFSEKFPGSLLFLLVGADQALHFTEWKQYRQILGRVQLCVAPRRAGTEADLLPLDGREVLGVRGVAVHFLNIHDGCVATEIRRRIAELSLWIFCRTRKLLPIYTKISFIFVSHEFAMRERVWLAFVRLEKNHKTAFAMKKLEYASSKAGKALHDLP
jgi:nicotinate (nicotinamide) nucleotide adenylyltransferase